MDLSRWIARKVGRWLGARLLEHVEGVSEEKKARAAALSQVRPTEIVRPRNTVPDARRADALILVKGCSRLRLTRQIVHCADLAAKNNRKLILVVQPYCEFHPSLGEFIEQSSGTIQIVRRGSP